MSEFYEGQPVYLHSRRSDTWVRGVVRSSGLRWLAYDGLVAVDLHPEGPSRIVLAWPGELVRGDAG